MMETKKQGNQLPYLSSKLEMDLPAGNLSFKIVLGYL